MAEIRYGQEELESRVQDLERRFGRLQLLAAILLLALLLPPIRAVLGLSLVVLASVVSVLLFLRLVMRLLDLTGRRDAAGPRRVTPRGHLFDLRLARALW